MFRVTAARLRRFFRFSFFAHAKLSPLLLPVLRIVVVGVIVVVVFVVVVIISPDSTFLRVILNEKRRTDISPDGQTDRRSLRGCEGASK